MMREMRHRLPMVLQAEIAECGLACVVMVAGWHGKTISMREAREQIMLSSRGATLDSIVEAAAVYALDSRALRLEVEDLTELRLPCILHWDMNHFVVLRSVHRNGVTIHDPAAGTRRISWRELGMHFTGVALELWPAHAFVRESTRTAHSRWAMLFNHCREARTELGWILASAFVLEALSIALPFHLRWAVDRGIPAVDHESTLAMLSAGFAILVAIQAAIGAVRGWLVTALSTHLNFRWLSHVFSHLLYLPLHWFERRHPGAIQSNFASVQEIQKTLSTRFTQTIVDGVMVLGTFAMMLSYSVMASAVSLIAAMLYLTSRWISVRSLRDVRAEEISFHAKQSQHFLETVRGIQAVRLYGQVSLRRIHWMNLLTDQFNASLRSERISIIQHSINTLLFGLERIAVIWIAATAVANHHMSVGMLLALIAYREQFAARMAGLIDCVVDLRLLAVHAQRVADVTDHQPEQTGMPISANAHARGDELPACIELVNVSFRYASSEPWVLRHVNLRIEAGESVAITGPSGCGKSTLAKLLLGLQEPVEGEVRYGGKRITEIGLDRYRRWVGTVMQDDTAFSGTIADNICFFSTQRDIDVIQACAAQAHLHDEIVCMPMGYDSLVGAEGCLLSGGQIQRLLLARALYKKPKLLVLDEATSHLDTANEAGINAVVQQMDLTRIVIAHRPQTIASADRVIRLERGRIHPAAWPSIQEVTT